MDEKPKIETLYGFACMRSEFSAKIIVPDPRNALEAFWWAVQGVVQEVIIPAFLFALAFTALKFALFA